MEKISRFLEQGLKRAGLEGRIQEGRIFEKWAEIVGPRVAAQTRPRAIRKGVLLVETTSAAWSNELTMLKPQFLNALKRVVGPNVVREIKFQITAWREDRSPATGPDPSPRRVSPLPLTKEEKAAIERELSGIEDPELRKKLGHFREILKGRQKAQVAAGFRQCPCGSLYEGLEEICPLCRLAK